MKNYRKEYDLNNMTVPQLQAWHSDYIDMGDGTRQKVEMPFCYWVFLEEIIVDRGRTLQMIFDDIREDNGAGCVVHELLPEYIQLYAQGMMQSGEAVPLALPDEDKQVHR